MEKENSRTTQSTTVQQGHIDFTSSSSFSNQNSEEFKPSAPLQPGHLDLGSSSFSNYTNSGEFKPSRPSLQEHMDLTSSSGFSNHNSDEFKQPTRRERSPEDSPARSSISSDHTSRSHGSSPSPTPGQEPIPPKNPPKKLPDKPPAVVSRSLREEPVVLSKKAESVVGGERVEEGGGGGSGPRFRPSLTILRRAKREEMVKRAALGFRVFGFLFCLVSFSVMAADRNQGWALDSFDRYNEFRYCMVVNVIGFVYSGGQALNLAYQLATGKSSLLQHLSYYFDFAIDQIITYLLISASSSAAARIEDWKSNWGSDKFPDIASAAVSMSFLAFSALASSALISGYALCTSKSMSL